MTKDYFRCTSHRGVDSLKQNNGETRTSDCYRSYPTKRFDIKCGNCQGIAHNRSTCMMVCKKCGFTPYRGHLVRVSSVCNQKIAQCEIDNCN